tara:strand:+ start:390 stop:917 length:528 start_codon:yes stop_codon:yes gene_type:complete
MIRVLGGKFKGKKLNNFKLESLRPTKAIVRKSIMDTLMSFENKNILDLFSGAGTLGIEALSRGAKSVCFVDKNPQAIKILKKNINMFDSECKIDIKLSDVFVFLEKNNLKFDIIFADPPYDKYEFNDFVQLIKMTLVIDGVFCFETNKFSNKILENVKIKKYGATQVVFWRNNER